MWKLFFLVSLMQAHDDIFYGELLQDNIKKNFLSLTRDINQPNFCLSSWAFAATDSMATQLNKVKKNQFPTVVLSPQMVINCRDQSQVFSCTDDSQISMSKVLDQLISQGASEEGCNNYYANEAADCSNLNKCKDCENGEDIHQVPKCTPKRFQVYKLNKYELLDSEEKNRAAKYK